MAYLNSRALYLTSAVIVSLILILEGRSVLARPPI